MLRPQTRRRIKLTVLVSVIAIPSILLARMLYFPLFVQMPNLDNEYNTAQVIRDVQDFVESHDGAWPGFWSEIGSGRDRSEFTVVRFDLTTQDFLDDPALIHEAIQPVTGKYVTYPHARRQLEDLQKTIEEMSDRGAPIDNGRAIDSGVDGGSP